MEPVHVESAATAAVPSVSVVAPTSATSRKPTTGKSPNRIALERLGRDRVAMTCLGIVVFFILVAIFAPLLAKLEGQTYFDHHQDLIDRNGFPVIGTTGDHWFGIEPRLGRDLFARWVYGARPSLLVAALATVISTVIGVVIGLIAGFARGWVDRILSWFIDFILSLPFLLFAIAFSSVLLLMLGGREAVTQEEVAQIRFINLVCVLSLFGWASLARLIRGQVLSLREREFITAARALGVPTGSILFRELLPNLVAPIVISVSLAMPGFIVAEAGLTFLGVGLVEPTPAWGLTIAQAQTWYKAHPIYLWLPVLGITILVLALSLLGDAVRDAFDPKTRR